MISRACIALELSLPVRRVGDTQSPRLRAGDPTVRSCDVAWFELRLGEPALQRAAGRV